MMFVILTTCVSWCLGVTDILSPDHSEVNSSNPGAPPNIKFLGNYLKFLRILRCKDPRFLIRVSVQTVT